MTKRTFLLIVPVLGLFICSCGNGSEKILEKLRKSSTVYTSNSECMIQCLNVSKKEVRAVLDSGTVVLDSSNLKGQDPIYLITGQGDNDLRVTVSCGDSVANVLDVRRTSVKDTCRCD